MKARERGRSEVRDERFSRRNPYQSLFFLKNVQRHSLRREERKRDLSRRTDVQMSKQVSSGGYEPGDVGRGRGLTATCIMTSWMMG